MTRNIISIQVYQFVNIQRIIKGAAFMKAKGKKALNHDQKIEKCSQFIKSFEDYDIPDLGPLYERYGHKKYLIKMQQLANGEIDSIEILYEDLESFFRKDDEKQLMIEIKSNSCRSIKIFTDIICKLMPERNKQVPNTEEIQHRFDNLLNNQRKQNYQETSEGQKAQGQFIPFKMLNKIDVFITFGPSSKLHIETITDLTADKIGSLIIIKAIVVRTSQVKPQLKVATYACDICGFENYQSINNREYTPLTKCMSKKCVENKINGKLTFLPGHSTFIEFQELKVQETPDQLNSGSIPKTFVIHLKGTNCKKASPGDIIVVQGVLLPIKRQNKKRQQALSFSSYIEAFKVTREKKKYVELAITEQQQMQIHSVKQKMNDQDLFVKLAKSIAPEIYGLETVKKALLLLLVGGITKKTYDNLKIRGEINIALIGDPGIAKSQLLKYISHVAPRGVYTTGKGSSGVGLTAAIVVDPETKEICLEAGALVLADMGVCCIDQFDKMSEYDRTAIHQVMEQQTVSIAKAGITTSLNARASILAAANPLYGRYNKKQTPHKNINLPAALLSRFDLIFILLDVADSVRDQQLAMHIGRVHRNLMAPQAEKVFDSNFVRTFIALSKQFTPVINKQLHEQIISRYVERRKDQMDVSKQGTNYTTTRSLLALIRLCQARARLRFSNQVSRNDLLDCIQIMEESQKYSQEKDDAKKFNNDISSSIFSIIKSMCHGSSKNSSIELESIEKRIIARGFSLEDLKKTLSEYETLNVIMVSNDRLTILS